MTLIPHWLRRPFELGLGPVANGLIVARVHPNTLTTIGFLVLVASGVAFGAGRIHLGGGLLLTSGVLDMLDGKVARAGGQMSRFGAFYDSTLDRLGESALFAGIIVFFMRGAVPDAWAVWAVLAAVVAMASGLTVSYARARAEGLALECKVGLAQRAERILGLGVPMLFFGAGTDGILLLSIVGVLAALALVTVGQRIFHVYRLTRSGAPEVRAVEPVEPVAVLADSRGERTKR